MRSNQNNNHHQQHHIRRPGAKTSGNTNMTRDLRQTTPLGLLALLALLCATCCLCHIPLQAEAATRDEGKSILADIKKYDTCVVQSVFSFLYPASYPPKSMDEFRAACRQQAEAFKCIKDKSKGSLPLLRRGMVTFVATRQRHHRRFCTNLESEQTKRLVQATTCIMEKRFEQQKANDVMLVQKLVEIQRRNYNDSSVELKQVCCAMYTFKRTFREQVGAECASHTHMAGELLEAIITDDVTLVCEDDEKMAKVCPKLESLNVKPDPNFKLAPGRSAAALGLYLIATLGEPAEEVADI